MPQYGSSTVNRAQLRHILTTTGGFVLACGWSWDVKSKHIGAGIYRISLEARP